MHNSESRIHAIDFTKGALVLLMVVYHVLNYLQFGSVPHDYMAFLPSSFIMITGFLATRIYSRQHELPFNSIALRLVTRALKLLILFTCLNIAARLVWSRNHYGTELSIDTFLAQWFDVYVTGDAKGVAFEVLVPISYTILLSIGVLRIQAAKPVWLGVFAIGAFSLCTLMAVQGRTINNLNFVSAGVIGMALGNLGSESVDRIARTWQLPVALTVLYLFFLILGLDNYASQIFMTCVSLSVLYSIGSIVQSGRWWFRQICVLGRYSLIAYIVQILYLQGTRVLTGYAPESPIGKAILLALLIALLTWWTVLGVEYGRLRIKAVDRVYKALFA